MLPRDVEDLLDLAGVCFLAEAGLIAARKVNVMPPGGLEASERMLARVRAKWGIPEMEEVKS